MLCEHQGHRWADCRRFLESLSAKVHPTPLSIDALVSMFQDFYTKAEASISTHIAAISSRLSRERSSAIATKTNISRKSSPSGRSASSGDLQMLSASEILDRRKSRHLLQLKKLALEEAVER